MSSTTFFSHSDTLSSYNEVEDIAYLLLNLKRGEIPCSPTSSDEDDLKLDCSPKTQQPKSRQHNHLPHYQSSDLSGPSSAEESQPLPEPDDEDEHQIDDGKDDEWLDSGDTVRRYTQIKKAPSGTACLKHKKAKKRCPEDCPLRTSSPVAMSEEEHLSTDDLSPFPSSLLDGADSHSEELGESDFDEQEARDMEHHQHFISRRSELRAPLSNSQRKRAHDQIASILSSPTGSQNKGRSAKDRSEVPSIVDPHTRSPATSSHNRVEILSPSTPKRRAISSSSEESYYHQQSRRAAYNSNYYFYDSSSDEEIAFEDSPSPLLSSAKKPARSSKTERSKSSSGAKRSNKSSSNRRSFGVNRKYLPSACEKHKLSHARCPANCPDRLERDAKLTESGSTFDA